MSEQNPDSSKQPPSFGRVFSTTAKVILAACLIALGVGFVIFMIRLAAAGPGSSGYSRKMDEIENKRADEKRTSMPSSKWNQTIAAAIKNHCPLEGMNKEEVRSAIGSPDEDLDGSMWKYHKTVQNECVRYNADNCAEYRQEKQTESFTFTPSGYLTEYQEPRDIANNWIRASAFTSLSIRATTKVGEEIDQRSPETSY